MEDPTGRARAGGGGLEALADPNVARDTAGRSLGRDRMLGWRGCPRLGAAGTAGRRTDPSSESADDADPELVALARANQRSSSCGQVQSARSSNNWRYVDSGNSRHRQRRGGAVPPISTGCISASASANLPGDPWQRGRGAARRSWRCVASMPTALGASPVVEFSESATETQGRIHTSAAASRSRKQLRRQDRRLPFVGAGAERQHNRQRGSITTSPVVVSQQDQKSQL